MGTPPGMRRTAAGLSLAFALGHAGAAPAVQTLDAGVPQAGPVLVPGGVSWADATAVRSATGRFAALPAGATVGDVSAGGGQLTYSLAVVSGTQAFAVPTSGGVPTALAACPAGSGTPGAALGDGFTVLRGCAPDPTVTIDATAVGHGTTIAAAGAYAAWAAGPTVTVARARPSFAVLGDVPAAGAWALGPDGSVATAAAGVGTTVLASTPPGGSPEPIGEEAGGVFGLSAAAGPTVAFATQGENGSQTVVVRRGGERVEVARFWPDPTLTGPIATDGTRVAWFSARCGGTDVTVAEIGEPPVDQRGTPCPVAVAPDGRLQRTVLIPWLTCDTRVAPRACTARVRVSAGGRMIASGTVGLSQTEGGPVALTPAGRALVRGRSRLRAEVEVVRPIAGGTPLATRRRVTFVRG